MEKHQLESQIFQMIESGKDYLEIKKMLERKALPAETLKQLLRLTDESIAAFLLEKQKKSKFLVQVLLGITIVLIGIFVLLISGNITERVYILPYGILLGGGWYLKESYKKYKRPITLGRSGSRFRTKKERRF